MGYKKYYSKKNRRSTRSMRKKRRLTRAVSAMMPKSPVVFGIVHAKWCGHCKHLMDSSSPSDKSIWQKTKDIVGKMANVVEIEESEMAHKLQEFNQKHGVNLSVNGFPTIFKIKNGQLHTDFSGERTPEKLADWVKK